MDFKTIDHVAIIGSNYDVMKEFYVLKLGMEVIKETVRAKKNDIKIDLRFGELTFELFIKNDAPERITHPEAKGLRHVSFHTDNIENDIAELKEKGVRVEAVRRDELNNRKMTFFFDPEGLPWELHE
ncbi:SMU1112c/YaeR family gloxylase I-like metalloprotein [Pediococcus claussenii]|uniref:VOC domain-containing protein n=1 Tax=Pediococcus claussenii (strain ATCC BAA-344 / DSM 14800 / JCM 18046 / KCTC 3811 / LMG 21948 / P06) TaxID=701521 RepID=G8PBK2_PEDCP|nr:VOC family protein [Pediococcus claussenii]AEV94751.1 hypothetical protein PECL_448 [Pediococcus claussenii ATCC BAA-344]ANZ69947.1 hypothetical protein AYR57_06310 [Pediococcus claussenii]ANZ71763.1 hypothetical protein AYR58_06310 [Pediococcus claussenii]KRN20930.1 hypothetical protein IV79_GL000155 [Pediococcus claussenii]